jgi:adenylate cyclase
MQPLFMSIETERKFLVKQDLWNTVKNEGAVYQQGYLLRSKTKTIRVRLVEDVKGYITIKGASKGASRPEYEYPIPVKDAHELLSHFCDAIISKKRFKIHVNDKLWEVDEFMGDNEGLIMAEIELEDEAENLVLPAWIGNEVTDDPRYYNSELSVNPYKNWH